MPDKIPRLMRALNRKIFPHLFSDIAPYIVLNEYPKSDGSWIDEIVSDVMDISFPANNPIGITRSLCHDHFLSPVGLKNVFVVWRDLRDVIVSDYYHCYFVNEHENRHPVLHIKAACPFADNDNIYDNLPTFIEHIFTSKSPPKFSWSEFIDIWDMRKNLVHTLYEDIRANTAGELTRLINQLSGSTPGSAKINANLSTGLFVACGRVGKS